MKWLLLIIIFQVDGSGRAGEQRSAQKLFSTSDACMAAGAQAKEALPREVVSIATCIPQSAFNGPVVDAPATPGANQPKGK
jgi:hypothetical protein